MSNELIYRRDLRPAEHDGGPKLEGRKIQVTLTSRPPHRAFLDHAGSDCDGCAIQVERPRPVYEAGTQSAQHVVYRRAKWRFKFRDLMCKSGVFGFIGCQP